MLQLIFSSSLLKTVKNVSFYRRLSKTVKKLSSLQQSYTLNGFVYVPNIKLAKRSGI